MIFNLLTESIGPVQPDQNSYYCLEPTRTKVFICLPCITMKKIIGYPATYTTYLLGHAISVIMLKFDWGWLYTPYNKLMTTSLKITDWSAIKTLWKHPPDTKQMN